MPTTFRLGDAWLNEYFPNKRLVKVFIQPNVSYGSLGKSVMPTTFRLGDTWLHENQLNHHKWEVFGLNLCNQGMNFSSPDKYLIVYPTAPKWVPKRSPFFSRSPLFSFQAEKRANSHPKVKCQLLIVNFVGFGCQLGYMIYISKQSTEPSCTQIRRVLVIFF